MNKKLCLLIVLGMMGLIGCSHESTVSPYELTKNEKDLWNLAATKPENFLIYQVNSEKRGIDAKIDHYQNGRLKNTLVEFSTEPSGRDELMSFGSRVISMEDQSVREWFITTEGAAITAVDDKAPGKTTALTSISEEKALTSDEYTVIGALLENEYREEVRVPSIEDDSLNTLINENEDVYVFYAKLNK